MFIESALAASATPTSVGSLLSGIMPLIIFIVVFYFFLMKPQQKKAQEHKTMISNLKIGDKVLTSSGVRGKITKVGEEYVNLEIADKVEIEIMKDFIASSFEKREEKKEEKVKKSVKTSKTIKKDTKKEK